MTSKIICKKCGKDIDYAPGSELFTECPRCHNTLARDLDAENADIARAEKKLIQFDFLRRISKYLIFFAVILTAAAILYNVIGFFTELFTEDRWWAALLSVPFAAVALAFLLLARTKSGSRRYNMCVWFALFFVALAAVIIGITAVPELSDKIAGDIRP